MQFKSHLTRHTALTFFLINLLVWVSPDIFAQSNVTVRVMAANLNGNTQSYQPFALRILQGTRADVVCIQEFNYSNNADSDFRFMVDTTFGTNFVYYREPFNGGNDIPNGIISRYPILSSGSWPDTVQSQPNRGYAWAQIDLPGTNDLYVVSVHLLTKDAPTRSSEAINLKALIQSNFPTNAWVVVAGDFNTDSRTESTTMTTFGSYVSDNPVPVDNNGDSDTSMNRNTTHDYVLPSFSLTNLEVASVFPSHSFPNGLVFDSRVYTPLTDVSPVLFGDSSNAQHMAVMKDFSIPFSGTTTTNAPTIIGQPQSQIVSPGDSVTFTVGTSGSAPLAYQWLFNGTNISGATTNPFAFDNAQSVNAGNYSVIVTNIAGSITSSVAILTISNTPPTITSQPQSQSVSVGASPTFTVVASGTAPLSYQWISGTTNIPGATTNSYTRSSVQTNDAGNYSVIVTNLAGSATSSVAVLSVTPAIFYTNQTVIAQWNFNSAPPDTSTSTGSTTPSTGSGTASAIGGVSASFVGGDPALDPIGTNDNTAWTTTGYPASTANNKSAGVQFSVSTAGNQSIVIFWSARSSNTGGKYFRLQYSTNSGASFLDFTSAITVTTTFAAFTNDLSALAGVNNNSNFVFRIVGEFQNTATGSGSATYIGASSTYAPSGTSRFDMVTISGTPIITNSPPAIAAVLSAPGFSAGQFQLLVTGSSGSNYVVQVSTNLATSIWVSLFTNVSPFIFTDTNVTATQKFYRAISQP